MTKMTKSRFFWFRTMVLKQWGSEEDKIKVLTNYEDTAEANEGLYDETDKDGQLRELIQKVVENKEPMIKYCEEGGELHKK